MTTKITTTPSPLEVVDKINVLVDESSTNATNITSAKNASITGLSVSGKVITYTKGNGTTGTIITKDTTYTHPNSGVTAGTYTSVTVNAQGHVTAGSNPTSGYHTGNATSIGGASATKPAVVVNSYRSGEEWYRVWSDGWVEQGGRVPSKDSDTIVTLHKPMADTNYHIGLTVYTYTTHNSYDAVLYRDDGYYGTTISTTYFKLMSDNYYGTSTTYMKRTWYVCGKGA